MPQGVHANSRHKSISVKFMPDWSMMFHTVLSLALILLPLKVFLPILESEEIEVTLSTFGGLHRVQRRLIPSLIRGTWASLDKPGLQVSLSLSSPDGQ